MSEGRERRRRRKVVVGLTERERRLLGSIRRWADEETVREVRRGGGGRGVSIPRYEGPSELVVVGGLAEKFEPLRKARKREAEAKRDQMKY